MGEVTKPITEDVKPASMRHACPHCGKMISLPQSAETGLGPIKTDTKNPATKKAATNQALVGKVSKGLHEAFPEDTAQSDMANKVKHD